MAKVRKPSPKVRIPKLRVPGGGCVPEGGVKDEGCLPKGGVKDEGCFPSGGRRGPLGRGPATVRPRP